VKISNRQAILTKYHGPTNFRGAHITAECGSLATTQVETMPAYDRAYRRAAGNAGEYSHNGAARSRVCGSCCERILMSHDLGDAREIC